MSSVSPARNPEFQKAQDYLAQLEARKTLLSSPDRITSTDENVKSFESTVRLWYPVYEHYGEKVFKESSIFWRALTYIPIVPYFRINISGFETYKKLGKDTAKLDMEKFKVFLKEDIANEADLLSKKIIEIQQSIENKRNSQ